MKKPVIALAQIKYFDISNTNNIEKIKKYIRLAKKKGADIVCFPEGSIHKKSIYLKKEAIKRLIGQIQYECRENSIWCIVSDDVTINKKRYNLAFLIDRDGKIKGKYKKINLNGDTFGVVAGKRIHVFQTDFAKIGIAICWDLSFSKLFRRMKKYGAQIVFCPATWLYEPKAYVKNHKQKEKKLLQSLLMARAFENLYFVALVNPVFNDSELISYSAIASPHKILKEIYGKEGLLVAELNLKEIEKFHKIYKKS